jgi:hypothetical protein
MKKYEKGPRRPWQKFYDTADWRDTSSLLKSYNGICQRILPDGTQCQNPSTIGHHSLDPRDAPHLCLAWSNLVAVCAEHHEGGQRGETQGETYCHTIGPMNAVYKHVPDGGYPCWRPEYNPAEIKPPSKSKATAIGDAALDAAIAAYSQKLSTAENGN